MPDDEKKSGGKWTIALALLAIAPKLVEGLEAFGKLQVKGEWRWALHFTWDWLLLWASLPVLLLVARWSVLAHPSAASFAIWKLLSRRQWLWIAMLVFANIALLPMTSHTIKAFYEARYTFARLDWPFLKARDEIWRREYASARRDLDRQGNELVQAHLAYPGLSLEEMRDDAVIRIQDSEVLLKRLGDAMRWSSPAFEDVLMVQRAYLLNAEMNSGTVRKLKLSTRLAEAIRAYVEGVKYVRVADYVRARVELQKSRNQIRAFLHQDELLRYCESKLRQAGTSLDPELEATAELYARQSPVS